jgi:hypothetical protein
MKKQTLRTLVTIFFVFGITASLHSCRKKGPADALITVTDSLARNVGGAKVVLRQDSVISQNTGAQANVHQEGTTDLNGQVAFSFPLEAVLNVEVSKGALYVKDYIRLEQSKQVEKTVVLK